MAAPKAIEESGLVDNVCRLGHCPFGGRCGSPQPVTSVGIISIQLDGHDAKTSVAKLGKVARLVVKSSTADDLKLRIGSARAHHEAMQRRALKCSQVLAGEEAHQIGRRVDGGAVDQLH